jgi:hypothetical protein
MSFRNACFAVIVLFLFLPSIALAQGQLEIPQPGSFQSGVATISGFVCDAEVVEIDFDGEFTLPAAYGTSRADTEGICGDTDNGFSLLWNWNINGDGPHTVRLLADGEEIDSADFTVSTFGTEFLRGESGSYTVSFAGRKVKLTWSEAAQNFVIEKVSGSPPPDLDFSGSYAIAANRGASSCSDVIRDELPPTLDWQADVDQNGSNVIFEIADDLGTITFVGQVDADGDFSVSGFPDGGDVEDCVFTYEARMSGNFNTGVLDLQVDVEEFIGRCSEFGLPCTVSYDGTIE